MRESGARKRGVRPDSLALNAAASEPDDTCVYVYVYMYVCVCIYIYIYIYVYV